MKIAELSRRSGAPIPTIKFYIREGMLPRGEPAGRTQAVYAERHIERLALIAALQRAGLSLAVVKQALAAMDTLSGDTPAFMQIAVGALALPHAGAADPATTARAAALMEAATAQQGWAVDQGSPVWEAAVQACAVILTAWPEPFGEEDLSRYAAVAEAIAAFELPEAWNPTRSPAEALTYVVLGTVLFEPLILALRRLAHVERGNTLRARRALARDGDDDTTDR